MKDFDSDSSGTEMDGEEDGVPKENDEIPCDWWTKFYNSLYVSSTGFTKSL